MDDERRNVFSLVKDDNKKEKDSLVYLTISYTNGEIEEVSCNWFGESVEIPGLFIYGMDKAEVPEALINLEHVKKINVFKRG